MRWGRVLKAVATPMPAILYAATWFSLQPIILRVIYILPILVSPNVGREVAQVASTAVYVIVNISWLASWYKLTKYLRSRIIRSKTN
ncbi:MAG: hypothetical protein J7L51_02840 [Desulfurococcales archaeon]|nr:hypothetical protein [Desulfurococcales archaeon]